MTKCGTLILNLNSLNHLEVTPTKKKSCLIIILIIPKMKKKSKHWLIISDLWVLKIKNKLLKNFKDLSPHLKNPLIT